MPATLQSALALAKAGKKASARLQLLTLLEADPTQAEAWFYLAVCAANRAEHSYALRETLRLQPDHERARQLTLKSVHRVILEESGRDYSAEQVVSQLRPRRRFLTAVWIVLLSLVVILAVLRLANIDLSPSPATPVSDSTLTCQADLASLQTAMIARCGGLEVGQACLMNHGADFKRQTGSTEGDFTLPGDRIRLEDLSEITVAPYGETEWGLATFQTERTPQDRVQYLLIGGANLQKIDPLLTDFQLLTTPITANCTGLAPSGVLIQTHQQVGFKVNRLEVDMIGTAFIQAEPRAQFQISVLAGVAEVRVQGVLGRVEEGQLGLVDLNQRGEPISTLNLTEGLDPAKRLILAQLAQSVAWETPWANLNPSDLPTIPRQTPTPAIDPTLFTNLSPSLVVFSSDRFGTEDIFAVDEHGLTLQLTSDEAHDRYPALAPDGQQMLFSSDRNGSWDIYKLNLADQTLIQLTLNAGENTYPSWVGTDILFTSTRSGSPQLWRIGADGANPQQLTQAEQGVILGRQISPTRPLAYGLVGGGIVLQTGATLQSLPDITAMYPAWSPDGNFLVYQSTATGGTHIWLYDLQTGETRRLTDDLVSGEASPAWLNSANLAFLSYPRGTADLFRAEVDTGQVYPLAVGTAADLHGVTGTTSPLTTVKSLPQGFWQVVATIGTDLYDVVMVSQNEGVAVGADTTILRLQGGVWGRMDLTNVQTSLGGEPRALLGVDMLTSTEAWAVGENGLIVRMQGGIWRLAPSPTDQTLTAIQDGWAIGAQGTILRLSAENEWQNFESPTTDNLTSLSIHGAEDGWISTENGTLLRWDGRGWRVLLAEIPAAVKSLSADAQWAVGAEGLWRWSGTVWTPQPFLAHPAGSLTDVFFFPDGQAWAVGKNGQLVYGRGKLWAVQPRPTYETLTALTFSDAEHGWAVGEKGILLQYTPTLTPLTRTLTSITRPEDLTGKVWWCEILQGLTLYPYELIIEPFEDESAILATGFLPAWGDLGILLEGELTEDGLTLRETAILGDDRTTLYAPNGVLTLTWNGGLQGSLWDETTLVGEIRQCLD